MIPPSLAVPPVLQNVGERRTYDKQYVRSMFDSIAHRYDFLNHFLSSGIDVFWRKKAVRLLAPFHPETILDVATGTADLAIQAASNINCKVVGVDISPKMLEIGRAKISGLSLSDKISLLEGSAESLQFESSSFDAVTVAFGVRNFSDLRRGLSEMHRVLKPGGAALILEFSRPNRPWLNSLYNFYFRRILPVLGGLISGNKSAYQYLPSTVGEFPAGTDFLGILHRIGFTQTIQHPVTFGIVTIYIGVKK